jgi:hypothetical protein
MLNQLGTYILAHLFKAKTSLSKSMHEVQTKSHELATSFTSRKALSSSQEVWQASLTSNK